MVQGMGNIPVLVLAYVVLKPGTLGKERILTLLDRMLTCARRLPGSVMIYEHQKRALHAFSLMVSAV